MKSGARPTRVDHRDYSYHATYVTLIPPAFIPPAFPLEYNTDAGLTMPNQDTDGLPFGCTDEAQADLRTDETMVIASPWVLEEATHASAKGGLDIRTSLDAARKLGWFSAYFNIQHPSLDVFDSIRLAMIRGTPEKRTVSIGVPWYPVFEKTDKTGVMQIPPTWSTYGVPWHNAAIAGWKIIDGQPNFKIKSWQGINFGENGWCYMSRALCNSIMAVQGSVAFTATQDTPPTIQTIETSLIEWLISNFRNILGL